MAEAEKKSFFRSRAFALVIAWLILGVVLTAAIYAARPGMKRSCEEWAAELEPSGHGEAGGHGEDEYQACHLVALQGHGFSANLAAAYHAIAGMPLATAWNIPNFLVLVTILWYVAKDGLNQNLKTRREEMEKAMAEAAAARSAAEARHREYEKKLGEIDLAIKQVRDEMKAEGEAEKARLVAEAETQSQRIRNEAEFTAKQEVLLAQYRLREEAAKLAVQLAEEVIRQVITDDDRDRLLDEYLDKVKEQRK